MNKKRVYVSSTFADLQAFRAKVNEKLRGAGFELVAMEDYPAFDDRPLSKCLNDVASCDYYIGIIAWRYGFIPKVNNPDRKSITQLEYEQACKSGVIRLLFLLNPDAEWKPNFFDSHSGDGDGGQLIKGFRGYLEAEHGRAYFEEPSELAALKEYTEA